ncbi:MAG: hypothetical protein JST04_02060 [Bdellovibrionales bacterium]|nr:hypothetical protein [Bdellovibrionales bacterium]
MKAFVVNTLFAALTAGVLALAAGAEDCVTFGKLAPAYAADNDLDVRKMKVRFTPVDLARDGAERRAYLISELDDCSGRGDCDSTLYLSDEKKCYRPVLEFRGKWKGARAGTGRDLANVAIESRFEGEAAGPKAGLLIERRLRTFEFDRKAGRYRETAK